MRTPRMYIIIAISFGLLVPGYTQDVLLEKALQMDDLRRLLTISTPSKGQPFHNVTGPASLHSKVAILGAGPAGIHMAYRLQKQGYTEVVILEPESTIGGQTWTVYHRGVRHEMGATHFRSDNSDLLFLINDLRMGPVRRLGDASFWPDTKGPSSLLRYLHMEASRYTNQSDPVAVLTKLSNAMIEYIRLHRMIFGDYKREMMPRPLPNEMHLINGTIGEFLRRHNIEILDALFRTTFSAQGYGNLDDRAALYGLMYVTPRRLLRLLETFVDSSYMGDNYILERGFLAFWAEVIDKARLNVRLNQSISYIIRTPGEVNIYFNDNTKTGTMETFDFLIISRDMGKVLNILDTSWIERQIFNHLQSSFMTSSLIDTNFGKRGPIPRSYYMFNLERRVDHSVLYHEDSYSVLHDIRGANYSRGVIPGGYDGELYQSIVVRQYGDSYPSAADINKGFLRHANEFGITHGLVLARKSWNYFTRFSPQHVSAGLVWDIFTLQGFKNTWYTGPSVCFDSIDSVIDYNNLVLEHVHKIPQREKEPEKF